MTHSAENDAGHWGDVAQSEWHIGTPGECAVPTCTAPPPCPCLPGAPPHDCGAGGYATDSPYICYPCSKGEHAEHNGNAWEPDIPCECGCPLSPGDPAGGEGK